MRHIILLLVALLLCSTIYGVSSGETFNATTIDSCYGNFFIRVVPLNPAQPNEYQILDCNKQDELTWKCICKNPTTIQIKTDAEVINSYDLTIEYAIQDFGGNMSSIEYENAKRSQRVENIAFGKPKKVYEPLVMPKLDNALSFWVIILVFLAILAVGIIFVFKWLFSSKEDQIENISPRRQQPIPPVQPTLPVQQAIPQVIEKPKAQDYSDDDIDQYIEKYIK